jgi:hypothetical protein
MPGGDIKERKMSSGTRRDEGQGRRRGWQCRGGKGQESVLSGYSGMQNSR